MPVAASVVTFSGLLTLGRDWRGPEWRRRSPRKWKRSLLNWLRAQERFGQKNLLGLTSTRLLVIF